jgi:DNA-binding beta-propeller fold protein YncE
MNWKNFKSIMMLTTVIILGAFTNGLTSGTVEWNVHKTLQIGEKPIDVAITPDGRRIFVLTEQGEVLIYSSTTKMEAKIDVGQHVDQIKLGPRGDTLILTSGENKTVQKDSRRPSIKNYKRWARQPRNRRLEIKPHTP